MAYSSLYECLKFLEEHGELIRVTEEVDPNLEMAAIHLRVQEAGGPALLFEKVKGTKYKAASNIFGTLKRSELIFKDTLEKVKSIIDFKSDPIKAIKSPIKNAGLALAAFKALPLKNPSNKPVLFEEIKISDLPLIKHWPMDGGAFVTLPQVYTEDEDKPGIMQSNLGMYRIQLNGNNYIKDKEIGLHYQLHRGIGVHQTKAHKKGKSLKVSIFVGGPPAHSIAAVMPLPEGMSEVTFAGLLAGRRFRYVYKDGFCVSTDADFVITGEVFPNENKLEGPFGDHLGYYSLAHDFPLMRVNKVYARKDAIWPFTVVGRPPQEDTRFGELIHELTGKALQDEIPGLNEVYAVDAAGVHPLLLALGSERYTPYNQTTQPAEILTIANHILGKGQLSLAKFLFITATDNPEISVHKVQDYLQYVLERINLTRDLHFYTNTSIDTLDYSGEALNQGSKVVFAAYGEKVRELQNSVPEILNKVFAGKQIKMVMPGVVAVSMDAFENYEKTALEIEDINKALTPFLEELKNMPFILLVDDANFVGGTLKNFLWVGFTRTNPSHDMHGVAAFMQNKHWGCKGPLLLDARIKPHHAPLLEKDAAVEKKINAIFEKGGSLYGVLK